MGQTCSFSVSSLALVSSLSSPTILCLSFSISEEAFARAFATWDNPHICCSQTPTLKPLMHYATSCPLAAHNKLFLHYYVSL